MHAFNAATRSDVPPDMPVVPAGHEPTHRLVTRGAERAVEPADDSRLGRAGHAVASTLGTLGEAIDGSVIGRAVRGRQSG